MVCVMVSIFAVTESHGLSFCRLLVSIVLSYVEGNFVRNKLCSLFSFFPSEPLPLPFPLSLLQQVVHASEDLYLFNATVLFSTVKR